MDLIKPVCVRCLQYVAVTLEDMYTILDHGSIYELYKINCVYTFTLKSFMKFDSTLFILMQLCSML